MKEQTNQQTKKTEKANRKKEHIVHWDRLLKLTQASSKNSEMLGVRGYSLDWLGHYLVS